MLKGLLIRFICLLLASAASFVQSSPPLDIGENFARKDLSPYVLVLEDSTRALEPGAVRAMPAAALDPLAITGSSMGFSNSDWWLRLTIKNTQNRIANVFLRQNYPLIDNLDVWVYRDGQLVHHWETGDTVKFDARPIAHRDFLFPLTLLPDAQYEVLARLHSGGPVNAGLSLHSVPDLVSQLAAEHLALGAYFGSFALLAVAIIVVFFFDRQKAFLYYLAYVVTYSSYMAAFNGLAFQFVWPQLPQLSSIAQVVLLSLSLVFLLQFSRLVLDTPRVAPRLNGITRILQIALLACVLAAPWLSYATIIKPLAVLTLVTMVAVIAMGLASLRAGQVAAGLYLAAWSAFLVGVMAYMFKTFGWLPHNFLTQYGFQIGSFFEFLLLTIALGAGVNEARRMARFDALTGLPNRSRFDEVLVEEFLRCAGRDAEMSLMMIDVDHFKEFNDDYGHSIGDQVLREVGRVLRTQIRRPGGSFRYGGEEFVVILPGSSLDKAQAAAERLKSVVSNLSHKEYRMITVSIGVASKRAQGCKTGRELLDAADRALYLAKRTGRDRVCVAGDLITQSNAIDQRQDDVKA